MPGKQIKNWNKYHALRAQGMSKTRAAKIANAGKKGRSRRGRKSKGGKRR